MYALALALAPTAPAANAAPVPSEAESILFAEIPKVETAALYAQTLQQAPANVSVITRQDIRRFGYQTLAEVMEYVLGFYVSTDGALTYVGVRGFSLPGDYNTRILVMVNGHYLTDNIYGAMYLFGQDFGLDMDLVQRIEIVRGPSSALYGSNGVFATINIFTEAPAEAPRGRVTAEVASYGHKKLHLSSSQYLGRGASLLLSASGFQVTGRRAFIPFTPRSQDGGWATQLDGQQGYHTFAQLTCRNWSFMANFADRKAIADFGWFNTDFGNTGTSTRDAHNFVEASWHGHLGASSNLSWRVGYDQFRYSARYVATEEDGYLWDEDDIALGDWLSTRATIDTATRWDGRLIVGIETSVDVRNLQRDNERSKPAELLVNATTCNYTYGFFAQQELPLAQSWTLYLGARWDGSRLYRSSLSPRLALVFRQPSGTTVKFLFGRAFRNPSAYERFWKPSPDVRPEHMNTVEVSLERPLEGGLTLAASGYVSQLSGLVQGVVTENSVLQYRNMESARAGGFEAELRGRPFWRLEAAAGLGVQTALYRGEVQKLPNSPRTLALARAVVPVWRDRVFLAGAGRYVGGRHMPSGRHLGAYHLMDLTVSTERLHRDFDLGLGVRNLFDQRYFDVLSQEHATQVIPRQGRSFFCRLTWHSAD